MKWNDIKWEHDCADAMEGIVSRWLCKKDNNRYVPYTRYGTTPYDWTHPYIVSNIDVVSDDTFVTRYLGKYHISKHDEEASRISEDMRAINEMIESFQEEVVE